MTFLKSFSNRIVYAEHINWLSSQELALHAFAMLWLISAVFYLDLKNYDERACITVEDV